MDTRRRASLTVFVAGVAIALTGAVPTQADDPSYVALGDSFSAGTGTRASTDSCYRSPFGYPALIAASQGLALDYQACSGADTADVLADQLGTLSPETDYVTITIGGNDLGFADVITTCALPGWLGNCTRAVNDGLAILNTQMPARYDAVFGAIAAGAPNADVRVGGYPHLFNGQDCHILTFFTAAEMTLLNGATDQLDAMIAQRTDLAGFDYVDPRAAFDGHQVCDDVEWINNLTLPIVESFHPNRPGNVGYAEVFWPGSTAGVPAGTEPAASPAAVHQAQVLAVLAMDLAGEANLSRAEAAGVSSEALLRLDAQLRTGDRAAQAAALAELQRLDQAHEARTAQRPN